MVFNVNCMVHFGLSHVVPFSMVLDHRLIIVVIFTVVVGLVWGHLVSEETWGAIDGKIVGNCRGVARTSLSIHVVLLLIDLGTSLVSSLTVVGFLRL